MTLEQKIAEYNQVPFPLMAFIDAYSIELVWVDRVSNDNTLFRALNTTRAFLGYVAQSLKLDWLERETERPLHPTILGLLDSDWDHCDWYAILLEWPHVSQDGERLAYTRNAATGVQDRQTVTSLGKYLARHFSSLPSNVLRDAAALFTPDKFEMRDTLEGIVAGVQEGPASCMKWLRHTDVNTHPYSCYTPQNGWTLAVRIANGRIDGRCLCHTKNDTKIFVRSFARDKDSPDYGYSHSDVALESWLKAQGYSHEDEWHNHCQIDTHDGTLLPYIDGDCQNVDEGGFITEAGRYKCDCTDGTDSHASEDDDNRNYCQRCDCREDDGTWTGRNENYWVCDSCMDSYTCVMGQNGNEYYIHNDSVVLVGDNKYDEDCLADNNIVCLNDGDYANLDDTVCINGDYYLEDDDDVVYFDDEYHLISDSDVVELDEERPGNGGKYALVHYTWTCTDTGHRYHHDTPSVEIDDETYHPDSETAQAFAESEAK